MQIKFGLWLLLAGCMRLDSLNSKITRHFYEPWLRLLLVSTATLGSWRCFFLLEEG